MATQKKFDCVEDEMVSKLEIYCTMLGHFGWDSAYQHLLAALDEVRKIRSKNIDFLISDLKCTEHPISFRLVSKGGQDD